MNRLTMTLTAAVVLAIPAALIIPQHAHAGDTTALEAPAEHQRGHRHGTFARMSPEERKALRARVKDKIQTFVTAELAEEAGLDDKKAEQLGEVIAAQMKQRDARHDQRREAMQKLRELVESKANDANISAQMKIVADLPGREDNVGDLLKETTSFLTPTEQAKVMLAFPHVMKQTMHMVHEAKGKRGGKHGKRFGGQAPATSPATE